MRRPLKCLALISLVAIFLLVAACGRNDDARGAFALDWVDLPVAPSAFTVSTDDPRLAEAGLQWRNGNLFFDQTRRITVGIWDRGNEHDPTPYANFWTNWIREEILQTHNIAVEFITIPRWSEVPYMAALLAADSAPFVGSTFDYPTILSFAEMEGIIDMAPLLAAYRDWLPNLYDLLTPTNVYWNQDPNNGTIWAMEGRLMNNARVNTFVRSDWLDVLNMRPPTTLQEFEDMLIAFRDNAQLLLGSDANQMIPFRLTQDVGWTGDPIITSFIPNNITDQQWFVYGFDDRRFMMPGIMEGVRVLNRWFNEGLLWEPFSLYASGDAVVGDLLRLGFVGSFVSNWDYPFRPSEAIITTMQEEIGPEANFIVVSPFQNDAGIVRKQLSNPIDRKIFFPHTNTEPLASLLYLDWISRLDTRRFLQFGEEGLNHVRHANGAFEMLPFDLEARPNTPFMASGSNFDITITVNGLDTRDPESFASIALGFPGIPAAQVQAALLAQTSHAWVGRAVNVGAIEAEAMFGGDGLNETRNAVFNQAVTAPVAQFDAVWNAGMNSYMQAGGRAIIEERRQAWIDNFGDIQNLP